MKIRIRPLERKDAETSVKWRNNPKIWQYTGSRPDRIITLEDELKWVERVMAESNSARFAIIADESYIGNIYLTDIKNKSAEYHIFIGEEDFWGRGAARRASTELINFAKDKLNLTNIHLEVNSLNKGAIHLYEKLGFTKVEESGGNITMSLELYE